MKDKQIIVLVGGPSKEAEVSRRTGGAIAEALISMGYQTKVLELRPETMVEDIRAAGGDIVFNAIHGKYGEDGALQGALELAKIPYTGSGVMANAIGMNKKISKDVFKGAGIPTAFSRSYNAGRQELSAIAADIVKTFTFPVVIKPATQGSSIGVKIVGKEAELLSDLEKVTEYDNILVAETYLDGDEFTISVVNGKSLPIIEIRPHSGAYDYQSKYMAGATDYLVPAPIDKALAKTMQELGETVFRELQCDGAIRLDVRSNKAGGIFVLEYNTVPGMTSTSLVPKAARAVGISFPELCEMILLTAGLGKF